MIDNFDEICEDLRKHTYYPHLDRVVKTLKDETMNLPVKTLILHISELKKYINSNKKDRNLQDVYITQLITLENLYHVIYEVRIDTISKDI
jgi:hypothetical protein